MSDENKHCEHCGELPAESGQRTKNRSQKMRESLINRLSRVEGQVRGIKGMIEKDTYCDDILHQISAVQSAMKSISKLVLESHMRSCLIERIQSGETEVVDELLDTIEKML
jgi:CsoR family transcriptional regulator, copper-sensing transcriptional repressor